MENNSYINPSEFTVYFLEKKKHNIIFFNLILDKYLDFYKVGSGDLTAYPIIKEFAKRGKPIILSTGLSDLKEINRTINFLKK